MRTGPRLGFNRTVRASASANGGSVGPRKQAARRVALVGEGVQVTRRGPDQGGGFAGGHRQRWYAAASGRVVGQIKRDAPPSPPLGVSSDNRSRALTIPRSAGVWHGGNR